MMKMLNCALERNSLHLHTQAATHLHDQLRRRVTDTASNLESLSVLTLSTLLDPRFKTLGFRSSSKCSEAVSRLKKECAAVIGHTTSEPQPGPSLEQIPTSGKMFSIISLFSHFVLLLTKTKTSMYFLLFQIICGSSLIKRLADKPPMQQLTRSLRSSAT
uniref:Uncharacterized protein n=1 Tax=Nothobranchius furzeri TaxID=105023 RepID=A0A1A8A303_NOTFU